MEWIFLVIGIIFGFAISFIFKRKNKIYGTIDIENETGLCRFRIDKTNNLTEPTIKYAVFKVNHNVNISRDEQVL